MKRHFFESGDVIFREGEPSDAAYVIVSGEVEIVGGHGSEARKSLAVLGKGDYVGEMGAIDDHPRSASAIAKGPVVAMSVDHTEFMDMLLNRPEESIELLKVLFERLRVTNAKLLRYERGELP